MNGIRFDDLIRSRTAGASRRQLLHGLIGASVGLGSGRPRYSAKAKKRCKKLGDSCQPGGRKCCHQRTCGGPPNERFCCKQGGESCGAGPDCCNLTCIQGFCALN